MKTSGKTLKLPHSCKDSFGFRSYSEETLIGSRGSSANRLSTLCFSQLFPLMQHSRALRIK